MTTVDIQYPGIGTLSVTGNGTRDTDGAGQVEESFEVYDYGVYNRGNVDISNLDEDLIAELAIDALKNEEGPE